MPPYDQQGWLDMIYGMMRGVALESRGNDGVLPSIVDFRLSRGLSVPQAMHTISAHPIYCFGQTTATTIVPCTAQLAYSKFIRQYAE
ncbi:MAG: hypothetical protein M2R45_02122 [Verrucomicrobia subdivision 3 bacterium]|nr:hypothetical protein [Limisphaerales bacterium]MCS1413820.1 hypothetical protein [Limisphaerales bacterium]